MPWLLEDETRLQIEAQIEAGNIPDPEVEAEHAAAETQAADGELTIVGDDAQIRVEGLLTKRPSFWASLFGGNTSYSSLVGDLRRAAGDPRVKTITMLIDSPGGEFAGLFDVLDAMNAVGKPITARVSGMAASAAYAIASQADQIVAAGISSEVGSIGVVASMYVSDNRVEITSTEAPKKRPNVRTEEGRAMVRERLDDLHDIFVDAISKGRKVSPDVVNTTFGRGAVLLAKNALTRGMVDVIEGVDVVTEGSSSAKGEEMDVQTLKSEHPSVYDEVFKAGAEAGRDKERDRVQAHLKMGVEMGAMDEALKAVSSGEGMTDTLTATYLAAGVKKRDVDARKSDDAGLSGADKASNEASSADSVTEQVVARFEAANGMEV